MKDEVSGQHMVIPAGFIYAQIHFINAHSSAVLTQKDLPNASFSSSRRESKSCTYSIEIQFEGQGD